MSEIKTDAKVETRYSMYLTQFVKEFKFINRAYHKAVSYSLKLNKNEDKLTPEQQETFTNYKRKLNKKLHEFVKYSEDLFNEV